MKKKKIMMLKLFSCFVNQPASWDEDEDGVWRPPKVPNQAYKGPWKRKVSSGYFLKSTCQKAFYPRELTLISLQNCRELKILTTRENGESHGLTTQASE